MPITRRQSVRTMVESATATPTPPAVPASTPAPEREPEAATQELRTETSTPQAHSFPQQTARVSEQPAQAPPPPKRSKLGWQIRDDLIKQCKQIALDEGMHDYEALETLLEEALARRKARSI